MRLPILCGILGAVCLFGAHDWWELRTAQEEERQAWALYEELQRKTDQRLIMPPFGTVTVAATKIDWTTTAAVIVAAGRTEDGIVGFIKTDSEDRVILSPESIDAIASRMAEILTSNDEPGIDDGIYSPSTSTIPWSPPGKGTVIILSADGAQTMVYGPDGKLHEILSVRPDGTKITQLAPNAIMFSGGPSIYPYPQSWFLPDGSCPKCEEYKAKK